MKWNPFSRGETESDPNKLDNEPTTDGVLGKISLEGVSKHEISRANNAREAFIDVNNGLPVTLKILLDMGDEEYAKFWQMMDEAGKTLMDPSLLPEPTAAIGNDEYYRYRSGDSVID